MEKKSRIRNWKFWLLLIGVALLMQIIGFIGRHSIEEKKAKTASLTPEERVQAVSACTAQGASKEFCGCIVEKLSSRYSLAEMVKMDVELKLHGSTPELQALAQECL